MCVWQSQAPRGTAKLTGVAGCAAEAKTVLTGRTRAAAPAAVAPVIILRLESGLDMWLASIINYRLAGEADA